MPDPDLEIREGGRSPQFFSVLQDSFWSKNKGGGGVGGGRGGGGGGARTPRAAPLDPPL